VVYILNARITLCKYYNKMNENSIFNKITNEGGVLAIIQVKVNNRERFMEYVHGHIPSVLKYGGKIVYEGINQKNILGEQKLGDMVVIQLWENEKAFMDWWNSEDYRPWKEMRGEGAEVTLSISQQRP
jgi:uncharacterized protein (DUF1330 family)